MEESAVHAAPQRSAWSTAACWLVLALLVAWNGRQSLGLFGTEAPWATLVDERPLVSGAHPQHFYLGVLGADAFLRDGHCCAYDASFQAGYPRTPVFNDSRLAEVFLAAAGGQPRPAPYKIGLLVVCLLVPFLLLAAALGMGLSMPAALVAVFLGLLAWWGPHGRAALEAGAYALPLAGLAVLTHMGFLCAFHRTPSFSVWLGLAATALLGWFLQPLLFPIALPLLLLYYLSIGHRHASLTWHLSLLGAQCLGLGVNLLWLGDWVSFWWLRSPLPRATGMLEHRTFRTLWDAPLWGGEVERTLAAGMVLLALAGVVLLHVERNRPAARLLGLGFLLLIGLAFLGISWEPLGQMGTAALLLPGLWFAALPAAHALTRPTARLLQAGPQGRAVFILGAGVLLVAGLVFHEEVLGMAERTWKPRPLAFGLSVERRAIVDRLRACGPTDSRLLWEDRDLQPRDSRWAALLPLLIERPVIGGLDPEGLIEHSSIGLARGELAGLPIAAWNDAALEDYCRRYNIGWIAAWTEETQQRLEKWSGATMAATLLDDRPGRLFEVRQAPHGYALKGKATLIQADSRHLILGDVEPEDGVVLLSLHWQNGLQASPSRVQVEREACGLDPIGFIRLRVAGPVARVTLTWNR